MASSEANTVETFQPAVEPSILEQAKRAGIELSPEDQKALGVEQTSQPNPPTSSASQTPPQEQPGVKLPEKFKDVDSLVKAYQALEAKLGGKEEPKADPQAQAQAQTPAPVNFDEFIDEFAANSNLSPESRKKLSSVIPENLIDSFIQGQTALRQKAAEEVVREAGGIEALNAAVEWARANLSESEISAYNRAVASDVSSAKLAVSGLVSKHQQAVGRPGQLLSGGPSNTVDVFENWAQVQEAMKDKRYETDPGYRSRVEAKLSRSAL